jgi:hypothetical protein
MPTALTPSELIREAEDALTAARTSVTFIAAHPDLPVARMHACGVDEEFTTGPLLEVQLDEDLDALTEFAAANDLTVNKGAESPYGPVEHSVTLTVDSVRVIVAAFERGADPEPF